MRSNGGISKGVAHGVSSGFCAGAAGALRAAALRPARPIGPFATVAFFAIDAFALAFARNLAIHLPP
jgi:hypothetical protein